jgi:hypothetical protein
VNESTAHSAHQSTEEQDHPHACTDGFVYLGYTSLDEETGEEVERVEALACRRCAEEARGWRVPTGTRLSGSGPLW